jgi:hypothetical protein
MVELPAGSAITEARTDSEATAAAASRSRSARVDPSRLVAAVWREIVGPEVAANARPVSLRRGRLGVATSSSAWAQTLHLMGEAIVARLAAHLGPDVVTSIAFRHAGWEERPAPVDACGPKPPVPARYAEEGFVCGPRAQDSTRQDSLGFGRVRGDLTPEQREALDALEKAELRPELRDRIRRAMEADFVRPQQDFVR